MRTDSSLGTSVRSPSRAVNPCSAHTCSQERVYRHQVSHDARIGYHTTR